MPLRPPTKELGTPSGVFGQAGGFGGPGLAWSLFMGDELEHVPELTWPDTVVTYHRMRADAQTGGLYYGSTMPIRRYRWYLKENGSRPEIVQHLADDFRLPIKGKEGRPLGRSKNRFSWPDHLRQLMLAMVYGHMYFEQVGEIGEDGLFHLRKLAPRLPQSISDIRVARDGGLKAIVQPAIYPTVGLETVIPVDRLTAYIWEKEGGNWFGRSMFRQIYKNWLLKDRILRVGAINIERAGGVPFVIAPEGATDPQIKDLARLAQQFRIGEQAGGAVPFGAEVQLAKAAGGDGAVDYIRLMNEEMARGWLMMFMQLGQTETGSRALSGNFIDFFSLAQEAIADWVCDVFNQHVIEDVVDWNWGEDEPAPILAYTRNDNRRLAIDDLVRMIEVGLIVADDDLEDAIRDEYRMPVPGGKIHPIPNPVSPQPTQLPGGTSPSTKVSARLVQRAEQRRRATRAASVEEGTVPPLLLPSRPLRRQPYDHEVRAQIDFEALEMQWITSTQSIVEEWRQIQDLQIKEVHDKIVDAQGNLSKLSKLKPDTIGAETIAGHMYTLIQQGAQSALEEAFAQDKALTMPDLDKARSRADTRADAVAEHLAKSLGEVASRRAMNRTGGTLTPVEVADEVEEHLEGLTDNWLYEQLGGAMTNAQNAGRKEVFKTGDPERIYASELLDSATCAKCVSKDGTEYEDLSDAERDYPTGGYKDCLGDVKCRGTLVAVYDED